MCHQKWILTLILHICLIITEKASTWVLQSAFVEHCSWLSYGIIMNVIQKDKILDSTCSLLRSNPITGTSSVHNNESPPYTRSLWLLQVPHVTTNSLSHFMKCLTKPGPYNSCHLGCIRCPNFAGKLSDYPTLYANVTANALDAKESIYTYNNKYSPFIKLCTIETEYSRRE